MKATLTNLLIFLLFGESISQDIYNASNIFVTDGAEIHIPGKVDNDGFIQNNGFISFEKDWQNNSIYQGQGAVRAIGNEQTIAHNSQSFNTLIINSGNIQLEGKVAITNSLELINGYIHVDENDTLLASEHAHVLGGSSLSFIEGALTHAGTGYKYCPLGRDGKFLPLEFIDVKGLKPTFEVEIFDRPANVDAPGVTTTPPFVWRRTTIGGVFDRSAVSLPLSHELQHPVILSSESEQGPFSIVYDVSFSDGMESRSIYSNDELSDAVFAVAEFDEAISLERFYLSTTLSPHAENPDNRAAKIFGSGLSTQKFSFHVFDRWGQQVFTTSSLEEMRTSGFKGISEKTGDMLPSGSYPYILKGISHSGKIVESRGTISILN